MAFIRGYPHNGWLQAVASTKGAVSRTRVRTISSVALGWASFEAAIVGTDKVTLKEGLDARHSAAQSGTGQ